MSDNNKNNVELVPNWSIQLDASCAAADADTIKHAFDAILYGSIGKWVIVDLDSGDERGFDESGKCIGHFTVRNTRIDLYIFTVYGWIGMLYLLDTLAKLGVLSDSRRKYTLPNNVARVTDRYTLGNAWNRAAP